MIIKKANILLGVIIFIITLAGCSTQHMDTGNIESDSQKTVVQTDPLENPSRQATKVATETMKEMLGTDNVTWTKDSQVGEAFPIYLPGMDAAPSYYECKVTTNGNDAGYILVNVNQTDIVVAEAVCEGPTLTEQYRSALNSNDVKVYRYDWFTSTAHSSKGTKSGGMQASLGLIPGTNTITMATRSGMPDDVMEKVRYYQQYVRDAQCFPLYSKEELQTYYQEFESDDTAQTRGKSKTTTRSLKSKFRNGYSMPNWQQIKDSKGKVVGCGPTAWAMAFAYWRQFKGKTKLFGGANLTYKYYASSSNAAQVADAMWKINDDVDTISTIWWGLTFPGNMKRAYKYSNRYGYTSSISTDDNGGGLDRKGLVNHVLGQLGADKPVVLYINSKGWGIGNHYVTVASAMKYEKKFLWWWRTKKIGYYANFGWGGTRKWIYHKGGPNRYSIYRSYTVTM